MARALVVLLLALPLASFAQEKDDAVPPRVRLGLTAKPGLPSRLAGDLVDENPWTITVRAGGRDVVVDRAAIRRLDLHLGERPSEDGMVRGAVWGFGIGAVLGVTAGMLAGSDGAVVFDCPPSESPCVRPERLTALDKAARGGFGAGLFGGIVGGTIGLFRPGDLWERQLPGGPVLALRVQPRAFGAQLSLAF
ncbi:MAG: hypothetical protein ABW221_18855 [Vicinamibacteria bacterium]